jgi:hypothetical protein
MQHRRCRAAVVHVNADVNLCRAAYTVVLKTQLKEEDYKALKTLRPFLKAADDLMAETRYQHET